MKSNTTPACPFCGDGLIPSTLSGYSWQCVDCEEDFCDIEISNGVTRVVGKTSLVDDIFLALRRTVSKKDCGRVIDELVNTVRHDVLHGRVVNLPGLGTFRAAARAPRLIKTPGVPTLLAPARVAPLFKTSIRWKIMFPNDECRQVD